MLNILINILISFFVYNFVNCDVNNNILHLPEGSNCTYDGVAGKCVNFFKCERLIYDLPRKQYPPICSFEGKVPIVCCTSCDLVDNIDDAVIVSSGRIFWKNGQKSNDKCLEYSRYALGKCEVMGSTELSWNPDLQCHELYDWVYTAAGGRNALRDEMPHMALLGYGEQLETLQWICGGSLISEKFILTAGHCTSSNIGQVTYVALGILKRSDPPEMWQRYKVKSIIRHPDYKPPAKYHDIALLETEHKIKLSKSVIPICLPDAKTFVNDPKLQGPTTILESDMTLIAAGWGATGFRQAFANTLQVVQVEGFTEKECKNHFPVHTHLPHGYNKSIQLCFGNRRKPIDTCEGDSGGPLQVSNAYCLSTILGVTSYGRACGFAGNAGIYTRVVHYLPWIEEIVWG